MTLAQQDFEWLARLIRDESAIVLETGKEYLVESRLHPLARQGGYATVGELVQALKFGRAGHMKGEVVDAMTTNETSWFRDTHPWETLRKELLPQLFRDRAEARSLTIWCGAASSGQEPYTLALLLREHFATELASYRLRIVATDISPSMLAKARAGRYSQLEVNRGLPAPMLVRWFRRAGVEFELAPEVRSMVDYAEMNLADRRTWGVVPKADLVLLRNVLIYFDTATKTSILQGVYERLNPGGVVLLGSSETTIGLVDAFERRQAAKTIYYAKGGSPR